jgi:hypothetical protein
MFLAHSTEMDSQKCERIFQTLQIFVISRKKIFNNIFETFTSKNEKFLFSQGRFCQTPKWTTHACSSDVKLANPVKQAENDPMLRLNRGWQCTDKNGLSNPEQHAQAPEAD